MSLLPLNRANYIVEKLSRNSSDLNPAADLLADAFRYGNPDPENPNGKGLPDPFYNRLNQGNEKVRDLFRSIIGVASKIGHTIAVVRDPQSKQILGVSWIKERGIRDMNFLDFSKLIIPAIRAFGLIGALFYIWDVLKHLSVYPKDMTYISMVGVDRHSQGKGIGKTLINYAIEQAEGQKVALSTMNPKNIELYESLGFSKSKKTTNSSDSKYRPKFSTYHMAYNP